MAQLALILYGMLVLVYALLAFFIVFHLFRYTVNRSASMLLSLVFAGITLFLFILNCVAFFRIDIRDVFNVFPNVL